MENITEEMISFLNEQDPRIGKHLQQNNTLFYRTALLEQVLFNYVELSFGQTNPEWYKHYELDKGKQAELENIRRLVSNIRVQNTKEHHTAIYKSIFRIAPTTVPVQLVQVEPVTFSQIQPIWEQEFKAYRTTLQQGQSKIETIFSLDDYIGFEDPTSYNINTKIFENLFTEGNELKKYSVLIQALPGTPTVRLHQCVELKK